MTGTVSRWAKAQLVSGKLPRPFRQNDREISARRSGGFGTDSESVHASGDDKTDQGV